MRALRVWVATVVLLVGPSAWDMTGLVWAQSDVAPKSDESGLPALRSDLERVKKEPATRQPARSLRAAEPKRLPPLAPRTDPAE